MKAQEKTGTSRALIWTSVFVILGFVLWADWAELDEITRASGQVITTSRNQVIQGMEGGVLAKIPVQEGMAVKKGQLLVQFERTKAEASYFESLAKEAALAAALARLKAEIFGGVPNFPRELAQYPEFRANQLALFRKRQAAMNEEIAALEKSKVLIREELDMNLPLLAAGDVSRAEIIRLQRQAVEIDGLITNKRNKYFQDNQAELVKVEEDLAGIQQVVAQRKEQLEFTEVFSPMDGIVRNIRLTTIGGVAKPGEEIMQIVPANDDLLIEVKMRTADVAFVKPGLPATIKLDAYDYTIYGSFKGEVTYISADTLYEENARGDQFPYYRVRVKTSGEGLVSAKHKRIDIQPGMTATVEIITGKKSVLRYLTKPITKTLSESLGER